jgi:hypothetical protein
MGRAKDHHHSSQHQQQQQHVFVDNHLGGSKGDWRTTTTVKNPHRNAAAASTAALLATNPSLQRPLHATSIAANTIRPPPRFSAADSMTAQPDGAASSRALAHNYQLY